MTLGHKFLVLYDYSASRIQEVRSIRETPYQYYASLPYPKRLYSNLLGLNLATKIWADALKSVFPETGSYIMESAAMPLSRHNKEEINFSAFSALLH